MSIKSRLSTLENREKAPENGRIISSWEFPDDEAWEVAKQQHIALYPNHQGIRFIEQTSYRSALHDN